MTDGALLVDVDSTIPNLALMHISTWRRSLGIRTGFHIPDPAEVWASVIFHKNRHKVDGLRWLYPDARIDVGGGGIDLHKNLPPEVDLLMPDYDLYPEWDADLGFTSRGCIRRCHFCVVPEKEGGFRINQHPRDFHRPGHKKAVYMDNNILADTDWFMEVTDWILGQHMAVDFNQGLDLRLMTDEVAERIAELKPAGYWHFAFDSLAYREAVERGIGMLKRAGVNTRHLANFYVYMDNDADYDSALTRCRILRGLDCLPYIMVNRDAPRTQRMTDLKRWTRPQIFFTTEYGQYDRTIKEGSQ